MWDTSQEEAFNKVKQTIIQVRVLAFYDLQKPFTLQVDASKHGLDATLLQEGKPIAFASKSLTDIEVNYAQIGKKTYTILFGCKRFHQICLWTPCKVYLEESPAYSTSPQSTHASAVAEIRSSN